VSVRKNVALIIIIIIMLIIIIRRHDMTAKTARITFLSTPDFKDFLAAEAAREGTSVAELIRQRCEQKPADIEEEEMLLAMVKEVGQATVRAKKSLEKGLADAEKVLQELRGRAA
jgi:hypothetical protein